jgi:hypothetical protein
MVGIPDCDGADAESLGFGDGYSHCALGDDLTHTVLSIDDGEASLVAYDVDGGHRGHDALAQSFDVPAGTQYAVGLVSPQVGLDQRIGYEPRIRVRNAVSTKELSDTGFQPTRNDRCCPFAHFRFQYRWRPTTMSRTLSMYRGMVARAADRRLPGVVSGASD